MTTAYRFDDRNIHWNKLGDFDHFVYAILDIDKASFIADLIFKFDPHQPIILHRHKVLNKTFVVQGEHRIFEPTGDLKEIRRVGSFTSSPASPDPHRESGGGEGAIVLFSIRANSDTDVLYELLDDQQNLIGTLTMQNLIDLHIANKLLS